MGWWPENYYRRGGSVVHPVLAGTGKGEGESNEFATVARRRSGRHNSSLDEPKIGKSVTGGTASKGRVARSAEVEFRLSENGGEEKGVWSALSERREG
ncbi:hypothetical protein JCGZ_10250 [Jatropha curcas]|uniref:Uncharacterized protein n=1 Tax=Jatropha curcas TaxID=180498 RepID=A0A067LNH4_JATCU|nr:hypothetical protein JCGZ_10250 [Jatropha curcas]